VKEYYLQSWDK